MTSTLNLIRHYMDTNSTDGCQDRHWQLVNWAMRLRGVSKEEAELFADAMLALGIGDGSPCASVVIDIRRPT